MGNMTLLGLLVEEALGDAPPYRGGDTWPRIILYKV